MQWQTDKTGQTEVKQGSRLVRERGRTDKQQQLSIHAIHFSSVLVPVYVHGWLAMGMGMAG